MPLPIWEPSDERIAGSQLIRFCKYLESTGLEPFADYAALYRWSTEHPEQFWAAVWAFAGVIASEPYREVLTNANMFPGATWFPGSRLNFAQNLLRYAENPKAADQLALISRLENGQRDTYTYAQLRREVARMATGLSEAGVIPGDRVAGFLPNIAETVIAMLATASLGAVWTSGSPDFGLQGVIDRFGQVAPKVLIGCDGYYYNGKTIDVLDKLAAICQQLPSVKQVVVVPVIGSCRQVKSRPDLPVAIERWPEFLSENNTQSELSFVQLPFEHPLYILYSSGTTGVPKCIVHGAGGTLLQHAKEHMLHTDVNSESVLFYFTTCGWMMWNWLISGLFSGATLVLFDGSPMWPDSEAMFDMIDQEAISIFGTSAKYLAALEKRGVRPIETHQLHNLKTILSTGSPLSEQSYEYVYQQIKSDLCLSSISGGTDIVSCFALGNPTLPVYSGQLQCLGLGMAVEVWNDAGDPVVQEKGELVCTKPFPSVPIGFWQDEDNKKFLAAYFERFPGIWAHGDYAELTAEQGMVIHGRSDAVLNPGGVRIGTAEIYRQVEKLVVVTDSLVIGQQWQGDERIVLFVVLREGVELTEALATEIKDSIRRNTTPRHVPAKVIAVADLPRTISGKLVELAVRNVIHGLPVKNIDALANPEALEQFRNLGELAE